MDNYKLSFESFLKCTNEKKILLNSLSKYIKRLKIKSVLDIGAGNGSMAIPLSKMVNFYFAIEKNKIFVKKLQSEGIKVIEEDFLKNDIKLEKRFDLVLCSYVIPHDKNFKKFVSKAWEYVSPKGYLLIITQRLSHDEWGRFCKKIKFKNYWDNPSFFPKLINYLKSLGKFSINEVISTIKAKKLNEFFLALTFIASEGEKEKEYLFYHNKNKIIAIINRDYIKKGSYEFPTKHYFIFCRKLSKNL